MTTDWHAFLVETARDLCSSLRAQGARVPPEMASRSFANVVVKMFRLDPSVEQRVHEEFLPTFADGLAERRN